MHDPGNSLTRAGVNPALIGILPMIDSGRLFNCARCHRQVIVCRHCDRGQIYCSGDCPEIARKESLHRACRVYQSSHRGRLINAARQKRFRQRQQEKVTHQGSMPVSSGDLLPDEPRKTPARVQEVSFSDKTGIYCQFCQRECDPFLRNDFLRPPSRTRRFKF